MQVRSGRAAGGADIADMLALLHRIAFFYCQSGKMDKGAVEARSMVDDEDRTFQAEAGPCEHHHTVGRRDKRHTVAGRDIDARVIASRFAPVDPLAPETT